MAPFIVRACSGRRVHHDHSDGRNRPTCDIALLSWESLSDPTGVRPTLHEAVFHPSKGFAERSLGRGLPLSSAFMFADSGLEPTRYITLSCRDDARNGIWPPLQPTRNQLPNF